MNNAIQILQQKEQALIACIDSLRPVNPFDSTTIEILAAVSNALKALAAYPDIQAKRRRVLKPHTLDSRVALIERELRACMEGRGTGHMLWLINSDLISVSEELRQQIRAAKPGTRND